MSLNPEALKGYKNFKLLFQKGIKLEMERISVFYNPNYDFPLKYGIVISKKLGKANKRNRIKRQVRYFLRQHCFYFLPYFGNIAICFHKGFNLNYFNLHNSLIKIFRDLRKCLKNYH